MSAADQTYLTPKNPGFLAGVLFWPRAIGVLAAFLGQWIPTEFLAARLLENGITPTGDHVTLLSFPIFWPTHWLLLFAHAASHILYGPAAVRNALLWAPALAIIVLYVAAIVPHALFKLRLRSGAADQGDLYGSARWATRQDREGVQLHAGKGILIGAVRDESSKTLTYLYDLSDRHILNLAPTRSGKTASVVEPIAFTWQGSAVVTDMKGEIWDTTAGFRQKGLGHRCLRWTPTQKEGCTRINPLLFVRIGTPHEVKDAALIAEAIYESGNESRESGHWNETSTNAATGFILHECYKARLEGRSPTLRRVGKMFAPPVDFAQYIASIKKFQHDPTGVRKWKDDNGKPTKSHPRIIEKLNAILQRDPKEGMSVISNAEKRFNIFADEMVEYATSESDFKLEDLTDGEVPLSLYLVIPPSQMKRLGVVVRIVFLTILNQMTEKLARHRHELLFLLDEFYNLGMLEPMKRALTYAAGYGIRFVIIVQNLGQINELYGVQNSLLPNLQTIVAFTPSPDDTFTAKKLSECLGSYTIQHLSYSVAGMPSMSDKGVSQHVQNTKRPLMTEDEIMFGLKVAEQLDPNDGRKVTAPGESIILVRGCRPIKGVQTFFFFDPKMREWAKMKADLPPLAEAA